MGGKNYQLRAHHLFKLVDGYTNGYNEISTSMKRPTMTEGNVVKRKYTDVDAEAARSVYLEVSSNPNNTVEIVEGIDDRCRTCSNYNGKGCTAFRGKDLEIEDKRTLRDIIPYLTIGDIVRVGDLIKY